MFENAQRIPVNCSFCGRQFLTREVRTLNFCGPGCSEGFRDNIKKIRVATA
jgi:hypothetical protein